MTCLLGHDYFYDQYYDNLEYQDDWLMRYQEVTRATCHRCGKTKIVKRTSYVPFINFGKPFDAQTAADIEAMRGVFTIDSWFWLNDLHNIGYLLRKEDTSWYPQYMQRFYQAVVERKLAVLYQGGVK